jgi:PAT family beta-lactamase induction signal transducer AmpG
MSNELPSQPSPAGAPAPARPRPKGTLAWVVSSYFGEGLPWTFLHQMATEFLTEIRVSNTLVSSTSLLHLGVTFKFLFSPVVDLFGRKRSWVIALQILIGMGMLVVAGIAPGGNMTWFWLALGVVTVLHATHDIACDGFYLQALDRKNQALFSGVRTAAFRGAMIAGSMGLVKVGANFGWLWGFGGAGALMIVVALVNAALMPHPPELRSGKNKDATAEPKPAFRTTYVTFFTQPHAVLVLSFMFFYKLGDIMMFAMSKPMLRDIGIDTGMRSYLNGIGTTSFIVAAVLSGGLIARKGLDRCLVPMTFFQNLAIPLYIGLAVLKPPFAAVIPVVILEQFAAGVGASAHVVFLMQRCRGAFSASHYAFATAVVSLGSTLSGFLSGPINTAVGHPWFFTIAFIASWPSLVLVLIISRTKLDPVPDLPAPAPA